ncbi:MAG: hypothetical protein ABSE73_20175 [Planctomycetota bacterium]
MRKITGKDAAIIAKKLGAEVRRSGGPHELAIIHHEGRPIATFGIRRGSGELGHGHIPARLHIGPHDTKSLAQCSITREQWIQMLREKGVI